MSGADTGDLEDEYTDGGRVVWTEVAKGIVGIGISVLAYAYASTIALFRDGVTAILDGMGWWYGELIEAPFVRGNEQFTRAAESAGEGLAMLGPLAFPAAVVVAVTTTLLLIWGVQRYV